MQTQIHSLKSLMPELIKLRVTAALPILIITLRDIMSNIYLTTFIF